MTSSSRGRSKGSRQVNGRVKTEVWGDVNGFAGNGSGSRGDDENVQDGGNKVVVTGNGVPQAPQQLPQGSLVQWEKFLHVRSIKVMLVEDDDCTRHIVTALLRNCNYEVIEAANGFQAWKILQDLSNHIDLVLTEVVMPSLSGIGLLCKIMSHKTRKNVPVIMMSSHDSMGLVFKCLSKGAVDFLVKPIRKNELKNLWQHVWRRCHSSSGSGSESGTEAQKSVNSKSNLRHDNSCSRDGDDDESTDGGSDDGSDTQSSWTKQAIDCESPEAASPCDQIAEHPDSTCGLVIRPVRDYTDQSEQPFTDDGGKAKEIAISRSRNSEMQVEFPIKASTKDNGIKQKSYMENGKTDSQGVPEKIMEENIKVIDDSNGVIAGELGLKRPRAIDNDGREVQNVCHILRHSELSAFTRYKTTTNAANVATGITVSCPQPANISNIVKNESKRDTHSDGYRIYRGSSEQFIPRKDDDDMAPQEIRIQHIHHHHHVHHYHNIDTDQPLSNQNDFGPNDLGSDAPHCGSSNIMGGPVEGNLENYSLNKSGSGSKHGSCNVQNGSNTAGNIEGTNVESNVGIFEKSGSGGDGSGNRIIENNHKSAQREAALTKFRQKREVRCFQKKVRYQNRKKLAEQRPRVRGQFVKGTNRDGSSSANAADV
uniref:Two-component response regulator-like APRR7 isoform X1 n=1 Tax=Tanacetum cinerariifolium TaxID=118510 RepID=A0A6L2NIR0_TANCI|nr:two-component response regulator-like APRR7 isoform X1 [Tanacetum cinerariifolium]